MPNAELFAINPNRVMVISKCISTVQPACNHCTAYERQRPGLTSRRFITPFTPIDVAPARP